MKAAIVSPSAPSTHTKKRAKQFEAGLATLGTLGIECQILPHAKGDLSYIAATAKDRLSDLSTAYADDSVNLIITANGGCNASHLLRLLQYDLIARNPKPLIGFSDTSLLLNAIYAKTGVTQLLGPMVTWGFDVNDPLTNKAFLDLINARSYEIPLEEFGTWLKPGKLEGTIVGGNLVSLAGILGTGYEPDWNGKVFVCEETEEAIYRLDRVLTHFKNAGVWDRIRGLVIGNIDRVDETFAHSTTDTMQMITEHFAEYDFPILKTTLFGHNVPTQITLPIGGKISTDSNRVLVSM